MDIILFYFRINVEPSMVPPISKYKIEQGIVGIPGSPSFSGILPSKE
jgi:hypothetical protein